MSNSNPATAFIAIARIIKERGITGEVIARPLSGPAVQIPAGANVQVSFANSRKECLKVRTVRHDRGALLISFYGVSTREHAAEFRQATIEIDRTQLPELAEHEYYHHQIIGLTVVTADGEELGTILGIMETGGADVYIVHGRGRECLIPAVRDVIENIDLSSGIMTVTPLEGLLD